MLTTSVFYFQLPTCISICKCLCKQIVILINEYEESQYKTSQVNSLSPSYTPAPFSFLIIHIIFAPNVKTEIETRRDEILNLVCRPHRGQIVLLTVAFPGLRWHLTDSSQELDVYLLMEGILKYLTPPQKFLTTVYFCKTVTKLSGMEREL